MFITIKDLKYDNNVLLNINSISYVEKKLVNHELHLIDGNVIKINQKDFDRIMDLIISKKTED